MTRRVFVIEVLGVPSRVSLDAEELQSAVDASLRLGVVAGKEVVVAYVPEAPRAWQRFSIYCAPEIEP